MEPHAILITSVIASPLQSESETSELLTEENGLWATCVKTDNCRNCAAFQSDFGKFHCVVDEWSERDKRQSVTRVAYSLDPGINYCAPFAATFDCLLGERVSVEDELEDATCSPLLPYSNCVWDGIENCPILLDGSSLWMFDPEDDTWTERKTCGRDASLIRRPLFIRGQRPHTLFELSAAPEVWQLNLLELKWTQLDVLDANSPAKELWKPLCCCNNQMVYLWQFTRVMGYGKTRSKICGVLYRLNPLTLTWQRMLAVRGLRCAFA